MYTIENNSPEAHNSLLKFLGFSDAEVNRIISSTRKK